MLCKIDGPTWSVGGAAAHQLDLVVYDLNLGLPQIPPAKLGFDRLMYMVALL